MSFAIVYIEHGDFVADFEDHEEARLALAELVGEHPEVAHRVGILAFDRDGTPGDFEPAKSLVPDPSARQGGILRYRRG